VVGGVEEQAEKELRETSGGRKMLTILRREFPKRAYPGCADKQPLLPETVCE